MPCTGDRSLKFKVCSLMKKELHCVNVNFVWRCKECACNNRDHFSGISVIWVSFVCDLLTYEHASFATGWNRYGRSLCKELVALPLDWLNDFQ
jgi:hypothetical protein